MMKKFLLLFWLLFSYLSLMAQTTFQIITTNYTCNGQSVTCGSICSGNTNHYIGGTIKIQSATLVRDELTVTVAKCEGGTFINGGVCALRERACSCFSDNLNITSNFSSGATTFSLTALLPPNFTSGDKTFYVMIDPETRDGLEYYVTGGITVRATTATGSRYTISTSAVPAAGGSVTSGGTFNSGQQVTLTATPNAGYRFDGWYENNGLIPARATISFPAAANRTIEAHFAQSGTQQVATPVISPASTTFDAANLEISIDCATDGAAIFYTLDGSAPTTNSERYLGPFLITRTTTIKAIATYGVMDDSEIATKTYEQGHSAATDFTVEAFIPAPWQRLGENYPVTFSITTRDGRPFRLYHVLNGVREGGRYLYNSATSYTIDITKYNLGLVTYEIETQYYTGVFYPISVTQANPTTIVSTLIIEPKLVNAEIVFDNDVSAGQPLKIPLKFYDNITVDVELILDNESFVSERSINRPLTNLSVTNQPYAIIPRSELLGANPSIYDYRINYHTNYGVVTENGKISIAKIRNLNNNRLGAAASDKPVVVFLAGLQSDMYEVLESYANGASFQNNDAWSMVKSFTQEGFKVWYIGVPNDNYIVNNAYLLKIGLESIQNKTNSNNMHIICHSKGGLETRALLGNKARSLNLLSGTSYFDGSAIDGSIKTVTFLATPQRGASGSNLLANTPYFSRNCRTGCHDIMPTSNTILNLNQSDLPTNITYCNVTAFELNSVGALGDDGAVEIEESNQPGFRGRNNGTLNFYQDYVNACHSVGSPISDVCDGYGIHTIAALEGTTSEFSCLSPILPKIKQLISTGSISNPTTCRYDGSWLVTGSILPNAQLSLLRTGHNDFKLGKTDESGFLVPITPNPVSNAIDTFKISANGYDHVVYSKRHDQQTCTKIPMLKSNFGMNNMLYPKVEFIGYEPVTTNNHIQIKITGLNIYDFTVQNRLDSANAIQTHLAIDSIITMPLFVGKNTIRIVMRGVDTIQIVKTITKIASNQLQTGTYNISLVGNESFKDSKLYVDNQFVKQVGLNESLRLLNGKHEIRLSKLGYLDTLFSVNGSTTTYNLNRNRRIPMAMQDSSIIAFANLGNVQFWNGMTVKNISNVQHNISLKRYDGNLNVLNLLAQSETFEYRNLTAAVNKVKTAIILDVPNTPIKDSIYLLKRQNGRFQKIFVSDWGNNIQYEAEHQKLTIDTLDIQNGVQWALVKRQKPLRNPTFSSLRVHQSETVTIAWNDLLKDPDLLPNDMTYERVENPNFECTFIGDSLRLRHKTCQTGLLTFQLKATHDKFEITETFAIEVSPLTATTIPTAAKCFGTATGKVTLQISSPQTQNYNYLWNNGIRIQNNDRIFVGTYIVTVTDTNGCIVTSQAIVTQPTDIVTTWQSTITSCHVVNGIRCDATARVEATGGTGGYEYAWSGGQTVSNPNNLCAGAHTLIVKDIQGCKDTTQILINQTDSLQSVFRNTIPESCDERDGRTLIATTGSHAPYRYEWQNGERTYAPTGLQRGVHRVTVTDAQGCIQIRQVEIGLNDPLQIDTIYSTPVACYGDANATLSALSSGARQMRYVWSHGATTAQLTGLRAGTYTLTVTTPAGCHRERTVSIPEPLPLKIDTLVGASQLCVSKSGTIQSVVSGGTLPYQYRWSNGGTTADNLHLQTGIYGLTVIDAHQCQTTHQIPLQVMPAFEAEVKTQSVRCFGERNGQARLVNVGGGNGAPYRYSIDGQRLDTLGVFEGLAAGGYTMRIQDSKGCEWSRAAIVLQPAPIEVDLDKIVKIALGDSVQVFPRSVIRPEFKVKVTPNYNVDCDTCLNPFVKPYQKTTYTILVQDPLNGCFQRDSMTVWVENTAEIFVPNSFSPNQDGWNDYFIPFGGRKVKRILQMTVWARNGALLFKAHHINHSDETQGWDGKFNGQDMPIGTYMYLLEVEFWDESAKTFTGDINLFR